MILVTGATGRVGFRPMEALGDAGADAAAMVRVQARAADLPGAAQHVVATLDEPPPAELLASAGTIHAEGLLYGAAGPGRTAFVAAGDVAAAAARLLTTADREPGSYRLTGPEALSYADVAGRISAVFARDVEYRDLPGAELRDRLLGDGMTAWQADGVLERHGWIRDGAAGPASGDVRELAGRRPRTIEHWLGEFRAGFLARP